MTIISDPAIIIGVAYRALKKSGRHRLCDDIYISAVKDLTFDAYGDRYRALVQDYANNCYTRDGTFIAYSHKNSMLKLAKIILADEF
jgi:hypothetical protein